MGLERPSHITSPEAMERAIRNEIGRIDQPELQKVWTERLDNAPDEELGQIQSSLREFIAKRERILHTAPSLGDFKHAEKDEGKIQALLEKIQESSDRPDLYVGEGKTAEVFRDAKESDRCYKIVTNFAEYSAWNSIGKEAQYLEDLEDLVVEGARTPRVQAVIDRPEIKAISMEYLEAENVRILIEKRKPLPAGFNVDVFCRRLRAYINAMHERNIYHRDLHGGNVLVGRDGTPYVIDFGQAVKSFSPEHAYDVYDRTGQNRIVLTSDEAHLDGIEMALRQYVQEQKAA